MNIYENIYIGSFIYQLGIKVGKKGLENKSAVNLFQQTPADSKLSDLIQSVNGTYLIIEFKRDSADKKENKKAKKLEEELNKLENIHLIEISESCHYIGIGTITNEATINFYKYLKYFKDNELFEIDNFINNFLNHNEKLSCKEILYGYNKVGINNSQKFLEYIKFLQKIYNSGIKSSTGGIIIHKDENGRLSMLPTDNIENLIKNIDKTIHTLQNKAQEKPFKQKEKNKNKDIERS